MTSIIDPSLILIFLLGALKTASCGVVPLNYGTPTFSLHTFLKQVHSHLSIVQLTVDINLTLGNVASQIGNGMGDVVVGHSQDGNL